MDEVRHPLSASVMPFLFIFLEIVIERQLTVERAVNFIKDDFQKLCLEDQNILGRSKSCLLDFLIIFLFCFCQN